jgi:cysteinyl-tRNA synthetase
MRLYDTLKKQILTVSDVKKDNHIKMYACGPTVYDNTHVGHMRRYVMDDILKRALKYLGYEVIHVMNITDVGHLTGDNDSGEDKLEKGAMLRGKTVWDIAKEYEAQFWQTMKALNVEKDEIKVINATQTIPQMINIIQILEDKGCTYETQEAVYFDVTKFKKYGALSGQNLAEKKQAVRDEVYIDPHKKNPADFALWFKRVGRFANHTMHWESPWGDGFPGWHIECSAISMSGLDTETIDIHTGGIDHIPVHHENEIAQSESATGKQFVKFWVHHSFLQVDGEKMSKSKNNFFTIQDILNHNIDPVSLRLFFMQAHYRKPENFTWQAVTASNIAYRELVHIFLSLKSDKKICSLEDLSGEAIFYLNLFKEKIADDLNTAAAVANMWHMLKNTGLKDAEKKYLLEEYDKVFGLKLNNNEKKINIPQNIIELAEKRLKERYDKNFNQSDNLRQEIENYGYTIEDTSDGYLIKKK